MSKRLSSMSTPPSAFLSSVQQSLRDVLTALPRLLVDKILLGNAAGDEEIHLGKLKVITGSKYRQYCREKYGPGILDSLAEKYLPETPSTTGRFQLIRGPTAVRFCRTLLGLGNDGDREIEPYREDEGVTTVALPPVAPILFAFLIWKAGKHGARLVESLRDRLRPLGPGVAGVNGQASESSRGFLDILYDRMMGIVDSGIQPTSQNPEEELSALELPFLVALPISSPDHHEFAPPPLRAVNPDSDQSRTAPLPRNRRGPLAVALRFSTPDSVGLQSLIDSSSEFSFSPRSTLVLPDEVSEMLYTSVTSAIMRGQILNHDISGEHETVNRTPTQIDRTLGDHVGADPPTLPPFDLLLRPCSVHESLNPPKQESPGHYTILTEHNLSGEQHNLASSDDGNVLVLLLEGETSLHNYEEYSLQTKKSTTAISVSGAAPHNYKGVVPPNSTTHDPLSPRTSSPTMKPCLAPSTSFDTHRPDSNKMHSEDRLATPVIDRQDRETRNNDAKARLDDSRRQGHSVAQIARPLKKSRRTSTTPTMRQIPQTEASKHVRPADSGIIYAATLDKTGFHHSGQEIAKGSQQSTFNPPNPSELRSRSRAVGPSGTDTAACSSTIPNVNVLDDGIGSRPQERAFLSSIPKHFSIQSTSRVVSAVEERSRRNQMKTPGCVVSTVEERSRNIKSDKARTPGISPSEPLPSQEAQLRGGNRSHHDLVLASTTITAAFPPIGSESRSRPQRSLVPVSGAIPEIRPRPPQRDHIMAVPEGYLIERTRDSTRGRHNSSTVMDTHGHSWKHQPQSQSASAAVKSRPPLRKDEYESQTEIDGGIGGSNGGDRHTSALESRRGRLGRPRPPRAERVYAERGQTRRPDSPRPNKGQTTSRASNQHGHHRLRRDSSSAFGSRSFSFSSSTSPPPLLVERRRGQVTV